MKSQFVRIILTAGLTVLGGLTLSAQDRQESAKIPFAFHVNHTSFAAGDYKVAMLNYAGLFQVSTNGRSTFLNAPLAVKAKDYAEAHLTFACY